MRKWTTRLIGALLAGALLAGAAGAQQPAPTPPCALPLTVAPPFIGWDRPQSLVAADTVDPRATPVLALGRATVVTLAPAVTAVFAAEPGRRGGAAAYGGTVLLEVRRAGLYRVGLGAPAWVDMVAGSAVLAAVGHRHGDACSAVVKAVDYRLVPGRYRLQLAAATGPVVTVIVAALS